MNRNHARRIAALEARIEPVDVGMVSDFDRGWYLALCRSSYLRVIRTFADILAQRHYHHEIGATSGMGLGWAMDWLQVLSGEDREARIQAEYDRLIFLADERGGFDEALGDWVETADREGWPVLGGVLYNVDRAGFEERLKSERNAADAARRGDMPGAAMWRRAHPDWRTGMTAEAALAFEGHLLKEREQLYAEGWKEAYP